jgi:hypothetical protein
MPTVWSFMGGRKNAVHGSDYDFEDELQRFNQIRLGKSSVGFDPIGRGPMLFAKVPVDPAEPVA